jgi:glycosyltransferase involved in cell wall biosynthesis
VSAKRWVFVTDRADAHVARFDRLFSGLSDSYELLSLALDDAGKISVRDSGKTFSGWSAVQDYLEGADVVISGPLDSVSIPLSGGDYSHVGISWATDVMVSAAGSSSLRASLSEALVGMQAVVTDNYSTENALIALGMRESAIIRVPWGPENHRSDIPPKTASRVRAEVGVGQEQTLVLYPRSLEPHYDPMVFVEALAEVVSSHPQVVAVLVESGSGVSQVKEAITRRGIDDFVRWVPLQSPDDFSSLLQAADAVVVTPKTDGTSVTIMEAMSQGIPVVCSLTLGSAEWISEGITGWSFPVGDSAGLVIALEKFLSSPPEEVLAITSRAQRLVELRAGWVRSSQILADALGPLF